MNRIAQLRKKKGLSQTQLGSLVGVAQNTVCNWEKGNREPDNASMIKMSEYFGVSVDYILGRNDVSTEQKPERSINKKNIPSNAILDAENHSIFMIPVFESVSAGFGAYADDYITEYMPMYFTSPKEADESIFVVVRGDSMFPKIEDGDVVLVHKQSSVDSGVIAVVLVDETEALVKKIVYGETWIELHSVNPMYPTMRFDDKDVLRVRVLGMVKKIIKSV